MPKGILIIPTSSEKADTCIERMKDYMCRDHGGYSAYEGTGGWLDDDGNLIEEEHVRLETISDTVTENQMELYAHHVKEWLDENAVLYEVVENEHGLA